MAKGIAMVALLVLLSLNSMGNYWFTYGIWPRSWGAFAFFFLSGMLLLALMEAVKKSDE